MRALRNIPVLVGIARDMEELCPDAWMLNITNPMTTLCRAMTHETSIKTVGMCHEIAGAQFALSLLLDASFLDLEFELVGVNHLPIFTSLRANGEDGFDQAPGAHGRPRRARQRAGQAAALVRRRGRQARRRVHASATSSNTTR